MAEIRFTQRDEGWLTGLREEFEVRFAEKTELHVLLFGKKTIDELHDALLNQVTHQARIEIIGRAVGRYVEETCGMRSYLQFARTSADGFMEAASNPRCAERLQEIAGRTAKPERDPEDDRLRVQLLEQVITGEISQERFEELQSLLDALRSDLWPIVEDFYDFVERRFQDYLIETELSPQ